MGRLTLPASGQVYADANIAVYTINKHPIYAPLVLLDDVLAAP